MGGRGHNRLTIVLGGLLLLGGILLIIRAKALLAFDQPVKTLPHDYGGRKPIRPAAAIADARRRGPARKVAENLVAPPRLDLSDIERVEPRPPLSDLGLALPPKSPMPEDWQGILLYRPIATSSAIFESMGRKVTISGVESIDPDKMCSFHDVIWPCGQRARTAFSSWLRGRALNCLVPPEVDRFAIAAPCRLGKQDIGAWLVANGWAMALPGGIYGKAEAVARDAEMGIFGPPQ